MATDPVVEEMQKQTKLMEEIVSTMRFGTTSDMGYKLTWTNVRKHIVNTVMIALFMTVCLLCAHLFQKRKQEAQRKRTSQLTLLVIVVPICSVLFFMMQLFVPVTFQQLLTGIGYAVGLSIVFAIAYSDEKQPMAEIEGEIK